MKAKIVLGAVLAAVLVGVGSITPSASAYKSHNLINGVASWLAQRPVEVRCLTPEEAANDFIIVAYGAEAYVDGTLDRKGRWHPDNYAVFNYGVCEGLMALHSGDASAYKTSDLAWYIMVLAHESGHLRGHRWSASEAKTQCWAIRHIRYVMPKFGVVEREAQDHLISWALYWHSRMPAEYQLKECKLPSV